MGVSLADLVTDLRAEVGDSMTPSHGVDDYESYKHLLYRVQRRLYEELDWPTMETYQDKPVVPGERFYDLPSGINWHRIRKVVVRYGNQWADLDEGIGPEHLNVYNSDNVNTSGTYTTRFNPPLRWKIWGEGPGGAPQFEVWPIPAANTVVRFYGLRPLNDLITDTDQCDLDDRVIVLFAASELLARRGDADAPLKLKAANSFLDRLKSRWSSQKRSRPLVMGGANRRGVHMPQVVVSYPAGVDWPPGVTPGH